MRIFILSVSERIYSTKRIYDEALKQGHHVRIVNHTKCSIKLGEGKPQIIYQNKNIIDDVDVIIPRIGASVSRHGAAVVKEFEMNGVFSTARSLGILRAQNKVRTLQIMNRKNIPIPQTVFSIDPENIEEQIEMLGGAPVIIKLQEGTQGLGVILAESKKSAKSIIDTFYNMNASILIQEFVKESNGEDIRAFVVGGKIVSAMKRIGVKGDFRSNIHRGGSGEIVELTKQEKRIAIKATRYLSLPIAGVDMIRSKNGALLIEVNSTPGLQGIEAYTKINIAEAIVKYLEKMFEANFKNNVVEIRGEKIGLNESRLIKIPVDRLPTGTIIEIPVYVFNGKELGPTILLQGGLHGDEVNSIEMIRRMLIDKSYKINRGCVIVVPLLNVFGFLNLARSMHGKDVNRSFPGSKKGSLASRMAFYLMKEIVENVDFGIDFHTGGEQRSNYPQIRFTPEDTRAKKLATIFNAPFMFGSKLIPKSFRNQCFKNNIPILVFEGGESLRLDEFAIEKGIVGTLKILGHFSMISKNVKIPKSIKSIEITKRKWIRAKIAGLFSALITNGSEVKKGEILGYIMDTYGETKFEVKAPLNGYIIAINNFPIINMGDALFHIGEKQS